MVAEESDLGPVLVHPVTPERWDDIAELAGSQGFHVGCWCMWWRTTNAEIDQRREGDARAGLQRLVAEGQQPGLLAYRDGEPVGWAALAPRSAYRRLARTQKLQPVDDTPVWSTPCFYVARQHRRTGVAEALLAATVDYAAAQGAEILEGYPMDPATGPRPAGRMGTGPLPLFEQAGFIEVARRGGRPTVRKSLPPSSRPERTRGGAGS